MFRFWYTALRVVLSLTRIVWSNSACLPSGIENFLGTNFVEILDWLTIQYKLNRGMQVRRNMLLVFSAGAIFLVASGVMLAQAKEYSTDQDSSKQVVINNYYYGGAGPYYPGPYFYPASFYHPSFGCRQFNVSLVTPFHRRVFIHHPFRHRFLPRMFGSMRSGGRRYWTLHSFQQVS